ncbi:uracil-DNA glycosylase [uncultured Sutterella sp.]|mgnify:CR=1 FL=1|uniref:uracil-DNA glycosylase n=1 Tax=uncultured Sutterella sp. TaxID=286133 RepID=UPI00259B92E2|nr:uracil-DNA glycosylase [uncultured Sutterella sp.]MBE5692525.1 uracil-DNA glycosylase [Sutterella sp.]
MEFARSDLSSEGLTGRWKALVEDFLASPEGSALAMRLQAEKRNVYPPHAFRALELTPFESVRAVIVGQDPYHTPGKACGLAFSVPAGEKLPPSLRNIFKVAAEGGSVRTKGDLTDWAKAGVLLINPILTVAEGQPLSHAGWGWERLTTEIIRTLSDEREGLVFFLWGKPAQKLFLPLIDEGRHKVLTASHPSPLSATRGDDAFMKSRIFAKANEWFASRGEPLIDWNGSEEKETQPSLF